MQLVQECINENIRTNFPTLGADEVILQDKGKVYWKLITYHTHAPSHPLAGERVGPHGGVYCFVRKADGAILKAASYNAADKTPGRERAYLTDVDEVIRGVITPYGLVYLNRRGDL